MKLQRDAQYGTEVGTHLSTGTGWPFTFRQRERACRHT